MKINVNTVQTTTIDGSLSEEDIKAHVRERLKLPDSTEVEIIGLNNSEELAFKVTVRGEVAAAAPEPMRCTAGDCQFPSLAGGLCASHMSEAHRRRYAGMPAPGSPR